MKSKLNFCILLGVLNLLLGCYVIRERLYSFSVGVVDEYGRNFVTNSWFVYNIQPDLRFQFHEYIPRFKKIRRGYFLSSMLNKGDDKEDNIYVDEPVGLPFDLDFPFGGANDMFVSAPGYAPVFYNRQATVVLFATNDFAKIFTGMTDFTTSYAILKGDPDNRRVILHRRDMWVYRNNKKEHMLKAQVEEAFGKNNPFVKFRSDDYRAYISIFGIDDSHLQQMANLLEYGSRVFIFGGRPEDRNPEVKCTMTPEVWRRLLPYEIPEDIYKEYEERRRKFAGKDWKDEYATDWWWAWGKCMQSY